MKKILKACSPIMCIGERRMFKELKDED